MVAYYRALLKQTYINLIEGSDKVSDIMYPYNFSNLYYCFLLRTNMRNKMLLS